MSDEEIRALERAARSRSQADCTRYWAEGIRRGLVDDIKGDVVAAVQIERLEWAAVFLAGLRAKLGEKPFRVGDWVRVNNKRIATHGCYGQVRFPTTPRVLNAHIMGMTLVEIRSTRGAMPVQYSTGSLVLTVDPGPEGVIYTVAAEVKNEKRKKLLPKDDEEYQRRITDMLSSRGRFGRNRS